MLETSQLGMNVHVGYQAKRSNGPSQIAQILPNGNICLAGQMMRSKVPSDPQKAREFIEIINAFILFLGHVHGQQSGHFLPLSM